MTPAHRASYRIMQGQGTRIERTPWIVFRMEPPRTWRKIYVGHGYTREMAREIADSDRRTRRDAVDHDDLAAAVAGMAFLAKGGGRKGEVSVSIVSPGGLVTPLPTQGRINALSADRNGCEPSAEWLRKNNKSRYGSKMIRI
jgi:hypothetical protein